MRPRGLIFIFLGALSSVCQAAMSGSLSEDAILKRLKSPIEVTVTGAVAAPPPVPLSPGEKTFKQVCSTCHLEGLLGAPKFGNKADWAPRIAEGLDVLFLHATKGFHAMPPRGGCGTCTDEDIHQAIQYMVSHSK